MKSLGDRNCSKYGSGHIKPYNIWLLYTICTYIYIQLYIRLYIQYIQLYIYTIYNICVSYACVCCTHTHIYIGYPPSTKSFSPKTQHRNAKGTTASCHCSALPTLATFSPSGTMIFGCVRKRPSLQMAIYEYVHG